MAWRKSYAPKSPRCATVKEFQPDTVYYAGRTLRDRAIDVMS
jgi:hypothetical protein